MSEPVRRFAFVDGLRGLAALAVVLPHSNGLFFYPEANAASRAMVTISPYGGRGVQLFFVISGFVIAYSLRNATKKTFSVGNFVLRRSVRLDPPYWVAMFIMWAALTLKSVMVHQPLWIPTVPYVLAHVFYLQGILKVGQLNVVFWTLCIEFQLYLVFALLLVLSERLSRPENLDRTVRPALVMGFFLGSLVVADTVWVPNGIGTWFPPYWYMFLAGVLLCWQMLGRVSRRQLLLCVGAMIAMFLWHPDSFKLLTIVATLLIDQAVRRGTMNSWLTGPAAQLFGRLSYCIYLVHVPVALIVLGLRTRLAPRSNALSFLMLGLLYLATIALSYLLHVAVEVPCLRLSGRFKRRDVGQEAPVTPR